MPTYGLYLSTLVHEFIGIYVRKLSKLINKDELQIGGKTVTTLANVFISSTTKYIPLISKDIPCILLEVASNLDNLKLNYNQAVELINKDLDNFSTILKFIDYNNLAKENPFIFYDSENRNILDLL